MNTTIYSDGFASIYTGDGEVRYKFFIPKNVKMSPDAILSNMLKYVEWEFKYMSIDSIAEYLEIIFSVIYDNKIPYSRIKFIERVREVNDINWINKAIWEMILIGEDLKGEFRSTRVMPKSAAKIKKRG